ncbi:hypothetical protein [Hyphococcus sp.]|uniref:hypothetical protein n=1 Tax=Hyphococcus sp. TaxID=2038636 RepID=UPI0035C7036C
MFKKSDNQGDRTPKPATKEGAEKETVAANDAASGQDKTVAATTQPEKTPEEAKA